MEQGRSTTVLFVDDEPLELELYVDFFGRSAEVTPVGAGSAEEALETLMSTPVDCLVSDGIRTEDGRSFVSVAKERYPELRTILYSGSERDALPVKKVERYLRKGDQGNAGASLETLAAAVREVTTTSRTLEADGAGEEWNVLGNFSWDHETDVGSAIVRALAEHADRDVLEFPPLYDVVDSDALSRLLTGSFDRNTDQSVQVQFSYDDYQLRITADGILTCRSMVTGR
ncbi:HalOD1 output domain-containing protein [Halomicroarcula sp. GCM10025324]|uniref:HalOD1 output domain-containing protein n=1 Tax=Haloarcula TaxID=2237 RepID=UPI0023E789E0|nr:HalOD1 output domain-containing protein [Halomicroarcula sp. ZS-22-S1]